MRALDRIPATRVAALPAALDVLAIPDDRLTVRLAADDLLIIPPLPDVEVGDEHAIIDGEAGFSGAWLTEEEAASLQAHAEWRFPRERPALAQGLIADVPTKLVFTGERVLLLTATIVSSYLAERIS